MARQGVTHSTRLVAYILCALIFTSVAILLAWKRLPSPGRYGLASFTTRREPRPLAGSTSFNLELRVPAESSPSTSVSTNSTKKNIPKKAKASPPSVPTLSAKEIKERNRLIRTSTQALLDLITCDTCNGSYASLDDWNEELLMKQAVRDAGRIACLKAIRDRIVDDYRPLFHNVSRIVVMDVALHTNMGDSVLWRAAVHLASLFGHSVNQVCSASQGADYLYSTMSQFPHCNLKNIVNLVKDQGLILYHAGGNWGSLYRFVQDYRMQSFQTFSENFLQPGHSFKVAQLPQTIYYSKNKKALEDADDQVMNGLPPGMLTLFLRQRDSLDYANEHYGSNVAKKLTPDIAFAMGPLMPVDEPTVDILVLYRSDKEIRSQDKAERQEVVSFLKRSKFTFAVRDWGYHANYLEFSPTNPTILSEVRLNAAVEIVAQGKIVITNRMHGSVVATLAGRILLWVDTKQEKLKGTREVAFNVSDQCTEENLRAFKFPTFQSAAWAAVEYLNQEPGRELF